MNGIRNGSGGRSGRSASAALVARLVRGVPWSLRASVKRVPLVAPLLRALVARTLSGREFTHRVDAGPARGIRFHVRMPEDKGIWTGSYEPPFAAAVAEATGPGTVAYDIGGWHGFFAGVMAAQGAAGVHVFEPLPANAERIRRLIELNPDKPITLHDHAIGDCDGEGELLVMPQSSMAKLDDSPFQADAAGAQRIRVGTRRIDSVVASGEAPPPDLIKIDVEGAELLVLRGAVETLRAHRPAVFAETHSAALRQECTDLLRALGYHVTVLAEAGDGVTHIAARPGSPAAEDGR